VIYSKLERYLNIEGKTNPVTKGKILLIDDNKDLLLVLQIILKGQGYDILLASSIEEAFTKIKIHKPSVILMDVYISDQDGREFCTQIKTSPETMDTRVIMMSGSDMSVGILNNINADDFMQKPFDYNDLLSRINNQMTMASA
jgi:two-component system, OmpR family, response regulator VicR